MSMSMQRWMSMVCAASLLGALGCSGNGGSDGGGGGKDAARDDAGTTGCAGSAPSCVSGTAGGQCGDALEVSSCVDGAWRCPAGTIVTTECACLGLPAPGCTCTASGWSCADGGAGPVDAGSSRDSGPGTDAGGLCGAPPADACVSGTPGGQRGDGLLLPECVGSQWTCPQGTIPTSQCACLGLPAPGCTCTADGWVCGDAGSACGAQPGYACVGGTPGGQCGDALQLPECMGTQWTCPAGTIPTSECACLGRPPLECTCTDNGWVCPDAGSACGVEPDYACVGGTPGGQCGDALLIPECVGSQWTCPAGTIPTSECACLGLPLPGCTCTANGWVCPDAGR
jgi:hypothetical protein